MPKENGRYWWKEAVVYQCYWRSFFDTDGDGIGDLSGVTAKLDYIKELGADVIWLNPCYESPDRDNGYDIADYCAIMPKAGTMDDFEQLLLQVHKRGMRLIMDLVVNHTSDRHEWFRQSRSSRNNARRDWYIWRDPVNGGPPNNYKAYFSPSAWEFDETSGQYYFHSFAIEQPDLNWANLELRAEIYRMMRFWLDKGVDGFRMDVINMLAKPAGFPDAGTPEVLDYMSNNPGLHEYLQEMHREVLGQYDILTVGECPWTTPEQGALIAGFERGELNTLFHFEATQEMPVVDWKKFQKIQRKWYEVFSEQAWNSQYLSNHDVPRQVSKYADDGEYRVQSAKMLATLIHMLPGMPYIYQGEEIGMTNVRFESIDDYDDIWIKHQYRELMRIIDSRPRAEVEKMFLQLGCTYIPDNIPDLKETAFNALRRAARDNARTPMQWNAGESAGFSSGKPWIKLNPNYRTINVESDLRNGAESVYRFYQRLIELRRQYPEQIVYGSFQQLEEDVPEGVYAFERSGRGGRIEVRLNVTGATIVDKIITENMLLLCGNYRDLHKGVLPPYAAVVYYIKD